VSTRSRIGIIRQADTPAAVIESIYCHFDGYPEGVGQTLLDHWSTEERINELIALGDLSVLGEVIGEKHDFDSHSGYLHDGTYDPNSPGQKGWCLAYGRDREEKDCPSVVHGIDNWPDYGQECEYLFSPELKEWRVRSSALNPVGWNTVAEWEGFITIPDAIVAEKAEREAYEASKA